MRLQHNLVRYFLWVSDGLVIREASFDVSRKTLAKLVKTNVSPDFFFWCASGNSACFVKLQQKSSEVEFFRDWHLTTSKKICCEDNSLQVHFTKTFYLVIVCVLVRRQHSIIYTKLFLTYFRQEKKFNPKESSWLLPKVTVCNKEKTQRSK